MINKLAVILAGCSFGILSPIVKCAYATGLEPAEVVFTQFVFAWTMISIPAYFCRKSALRKKEIALLVIAGGVNSLAGLFFFLALEKLPASVAIVSMFQFTWMGLVIEALADRQWPGKDKLLSVPFLLIGIVLASGVLGNALHLSVTGIIFGCLSALAYAFFVFFSGRIASEAHPIQRSRWILLGAVIISAMVYPPAFLLHGKVSSGLLAYSAALGLLGGVVPAYLLAKGVPKIGPGLASILISSELPVALIASVAILGERISSLQGIGAGVILLGISLPYLWERCTILRNGNEG